MWKLGTLFAVAGALLIVSPQWVHGDELSDLKNQLEEVVSQNAKLQTQLQTQQSLTNKLLERVKVVEGKEASLSQEVRRVASRPVAVAAPTPDMDTGLSDISKRPQLIIKGFGDIGFSNLWSGGAEKNSFNIGAQDLFFMSKLSENLSFMLESDLHFHEGDPFDAYAHFHLERSVLRYAYSDQLNIKVGKIHTPLGYWNQMYHHGSWLQTTIQRPEIYEFDTPAREFGDPHGGFLPTHSVGLNIDGIFELGELGEMAYNLGVFNGRGTSLVRTEHIADNNDNKAFNVLLGFKPYAIEGLDVGFDVYVDKIPGNGTTRLEAIDQIILGSYAAYNNNGIELLAEAFRVHHDDKNSNTVFDTWGGYVQGGYKINDFTPYGRVDLLDVASSPFFSASHRRDDMKYTLGLRWDVFDWNAIRLEYSHTDAQIGDNEDGLTINTAYVF